MITDELREFIESHLYLGATALGGWKEAAFAIADRIDEAHESSYKDGYDDGFASADDWLAQHEDAMAEHGWVKLPLGADGESIRVGDVVIAQLLFGGESKPLVVDRMELSRGRDGDLWCVALDIDEGCWNQPSILRHHHPPTVDDVLMEFHERMDELGTTDQCVGIDRADAVDALLRERAELVAEYAAKLRLAGEDE